MPHRSQENWPYRLGLLGPPTIRTLCIISRIVSMRTASPVPLSKQSPGHRTLTYNNANSLIFLWTEDRIPKRVYRFRFTESIQIDSVECVEP